MLSSMDGRHYYRLTDSQGQQGLPPLGLALVHQFSGTWLDSFFPLTRDLVPSHWPVGTQLPLLPYSYSPLSSDPSPVRSSSYQIDD